MTNRERAVKRSNFSEQQIAFILRQAEEGTSVEEVRNLSTTLRHRRFLFTDSFLLLWKWRVG